MAKVGLDFVLKQSHIDRIKAAQKAAALRVIKEQNIPIVCAYVNTRITPDELLVDFIYRLAEDYEP